MAQALKLLTSPHLRDAEAVFTGCRYGRRKQSVVVPRLALRLAAKNIMAMRAQIAAARASEALPGCSSWMVMRRSTLSFGVGHFSVQGFGPNRSSGAWIDGRQIPEEEANGKLIVEFSTRPRANYAMVVLLVDEEAQRLANTLWDASDPPAVLPYEWTEAS